MKFRTAALLTTLALSLGVATVAGASNSFPGYGPIVAATSTHRAVGTATSTPIAAPVSGAKGYQLTGSMTGSQGTINVTLLQKDSATGLYIPAPAGETLILSSSATASELTVYPGITGVSNRRVDSNIAGYTGTYKVQAISITSAATFGVTLNWLP